MPIDFASASFRADVRLFRTIRYTVAFLPQNVLTGTDIVEQGFPPVDMESANWIVLILLVLACTGSAIQWRWKLQKFRPLLLGFWSLVLFVAWIGDGGFQSAEYVPRWAPTLIVLLIFVAGGALSLAWLDVRQRPAGDRLRGTLVCSIAIGLGVLFLTRSHSAVSTPVWVARRVQCRNNLKQIGLALHNYADTYDGFPATAGGDPPMSWRVAILPYVDQGPLFNAYDPARRWDEVPNTDVLTTRVSPMLCPAVERQHDEAGRYFASYVAPTGPGTVLRRTESLPFAEITDGTSSTLMVVESCGLEIPWTEPRDFDVTRGPIGIDLKGRGETDSPGVMSAYHAWGPHVLAADGSVRALSWKTDPALLKKLLKADGGDDVTGWDAR